MDYFLSQILCYSIQALYRYMFYKIECPFLLTYYDYKIHAQRRCQLYNINSTNITQLYIYVHSMQKYALFYLFKILMIFQNVQKLKN